MKFRKHHKKKNRYFVVSTDSDGCTAIDYIRAATEQDAIGIVALAREEADEDCIRAFSLPELKKMVQELETQPVPDNAFDLMRDLCLIDADDEYPTDRVQAAARLGLPGKRLRSRESFLLESNWPDGKNDKRTILKVPAGALVVVASEPDPLNPTPEGQFRIIFDFPIRDMFCTLSELLNRFLPPGKKEWNL